MEENRTPARSPTTSAWHYLAPDPKTDAAIYQSLRYSPKTGQPVPTGSDLFVHHVPGGARYFYIHHWSRDAHETNICQVTSEDLARDFLRERIQLKTFHERTGPERARIAGYFPGIFDADP
jgi:hypothetical protein